VQHVNWRAGSTCGILAAYRWLRRVNGETSGVLELTFGVDWRNRRAKRGRTKVLSSFHPGLWFVSGGGGAAMEEARYGRWAAGEEGGGRGIQNQRRGRSSLHCCTESWKLIGVANSKSKLCIRTSCCVDVSKSVPFPSIPPVLSHSAHPYLRAPALSPDS
jgi:hypothetical protein